MNTVNITLNTTKITINTVNITMHTVKIAMYTVTEKSKINHFFFFKVVDSQAKWH